MRSAVTKSLLLSAIAVVLAFAWSIGIRAAMGVPLDRVTLLNLIIIPPLITFPISLYVFRQQAKLARAHDALKLAHAVLAERASHDGLTGLLNRESFFVPVELSRYDEPRGVLLLVDADYFKRINDTCGHEAGDEALKLVARTIAASVRPDDPVGRLGGEEFGIFLRSADMAEARIIAERIRADIAELSFAPAGCGPMALTVSIGGALCLPDSDCPDILRQADRCLYEAKAKGRNTVVMQANLAAVA